MEIIPVIDLARGAAVHARGGDRSRYRPAESVLAPGRAGDALALARAYGDVLGARECYVADLDAIRGGPVQGGVLRTLVGAVPRLLVDAGVATTTAALDVLAAGAAVVVVGLETLRAMDDLAPIVAAAGAARTAFSLDLRGGRPLLHPAMRAGGRETWPPTAFAAAAAAAGAATLLLLDVGRVGTGGGVDLDLVGRVRRQLPGIRLVAGGGARGREDLERIRDAGCDAALVGSALHDGRVGPSDLAALARPRAGQSGASASR